MQIEKENQQYQLKQKERELSFPSKVNHIRERRTILDM